MNKSKKEVQEALGLHEPPDDAFMALLATVGESDVVGGPECTREVRTYAPDEIEKIFLDAAVGSLLAHARDESKRSLSAVGDAAGVSRARVQQIERSENIEIATLVRVAAACGYQVGISLQPIKPGLRAFSTVLQGAVK